MQGFSFRSLRAAVALVAAAGALAACTDKTELPTAGRGPLLALNPVANPPSTFSDTLSGTYSASGAKCDESVSGNVLLTGVVSFEATCDLTAAAGTVFYADTTVSTVLVIGKNATITANGTSASPVVFTSRANQGSHRPGQWSGIIIIGESVCNGQSVSPADCDIEGLNGLAIDTLSYGGSDTTDTSGTLRYVRIEYAGRIPVDGDEVNALTLYSVGSGTTIDYVQVHRGTDDGVELFGGTVNLKHIVATAISDDSFDYSYGWHGKAQFGILQQIVGDGDKGIEADNDEGTYAYTPTTNPAVFNFTIVGRCTTNACTDGLIDANDGVQLRRGVGGNLRNFVVTGFRGSALDVDDSQTFARCPQVNNSIFYGTAGPLYDGDADADSTCVATSGVRNTNPSLINAFDRVDPDFSPLRTGAAATGYYDISASLPGDPFFVDADYVGAVKPRTNPATGAFPDDGWYKGWTNYAQN